MEAALSSTMFTLKGTLPPTSFDKRAAPHSGMAKNSKEWTLGVEGRAALILLPWVRGWTDCSGLLLPAVLPACFHLSLLICSSSASPHHPPSLPWLPRQALSARPLKDSMARVCGAGRGGRESRQRCQISFCSIPTPSPIKIRYLFGCLLVPQGNHIPNEFVKKAIQFISVLIGQNPGQWDHYGWK